MARLPPSRHPLHCGLRIPDLRARDDSPLNGSCHQGVPAICRTRRLPAQRIRRCGLNATFRTRLQQCDGDWSPLSPRCYRVAHAARLGTDSKICDTVRLAAASAALVCGSIASASGVIVQIAGHEPDGKSVIATVSLSPSTTPSTIVSPPSPAMSAPDNRQDSASPSNAPQTTPLNAMTTAVTASTASTEAATTDLAQQPVPAPKKSQKAGRSANE